jgi:hypothetical protein
LGVMIVTNDTHLSLCHGIVLHAPNGSLPQDANARIGIGISPLPVSGSGRLEPLANEFRDTTAGQAPELSPSHVRFAREG